MSCGFNFEAESPGRSFKLSKLCPGCICSMGWSYNLALLLQLLDEASQFARLPFSLTSCPGIPEWVEPLHQVYIPRHRVATNTTTRQSIYGVNELWEQFMFLHVNLLQSCAPSSNHWALLVIHSIIYTFCRSVIFFPRNVTIFEHFFFFNRCVI